MVKILLAFCLLTSCYCFRIERSIGDVRTTTTDTPQEVTTTEVTTSTADYFEQKVNEVAGISCDVCLRAVYGLNYNVVRMKKALVNMIRLDCEALFHGQPDDIAQCIQVMAEKVEKYYNKIETYMDTRHLCVQMRMCPTSRISN